jgi:hypothetical protein
MLQPVEMVAVKPPVSLSEPVVQMNQEEEKEAHEALQQHFEEDRNELRGALPARGHYFSGTDAAQQQVHSD